MPEPHLDDPALRLLSEARRALLTTIDARDGRPRSVPICYAVFHDPGRALLLYSALDEKPKSTEDPRTLRRVRNLQADPRATILVDRWDEDWTRLAFVELECLGALLEPGGTEHAAAIAKLRAKYPQYGSHRLAERPLMRFAVDRAVFWAAAGRPPGRPRSR